MILDAREIDGNVRLDRSVLLRLGQLPLQSDRICLAWFAKQTDYVGRAVRLEIKRRERLESEDA